MRRGRDEPAINSHAMVMSIGTLLARNRTKNE